MAREVFRKGIELNTALMATKANAFDTVLASYPFQDRRTRLPTQRTFKFLWNTDATLPKMRGFLNDSADNLTMEAVQLGGFLRLMDDIPQLREALAARFRKWEAEKPFFFR
jgi:hypothetical protein